MSIQYKRTNWVRRLEDFSSACSSGFRLGRGLMAGILAIFSGISRLLPVTRWLSVILSPDVPVVSTTGASSLKSPASVWRGVVFVALVVGLMAMGRDALARDFTCSTEITLTTLSPSLTYATGGWPSSCNGMLCSRHVECKHDLEDRYWNDSLWDKFNLTPEQKYELCKNGDGDFTIKYTHSGRDKWWDYSKSRSYSDCPPTPTIALQSGSSRFLCSTNTATLVANEAPEGYGYQWYKDNSPVGTQKTLQVTLSGKYQVSYTLDGYAFDKSGSISITQCGTCPSIGGKIWYDINGDKLRNEYKPGKLEPLLDDIGVQTFKDGSIITTNSTQTDGDGEYTFLFNKTGLTHNVRVKGQDLTGKNITEPSQGSHTVNLACDSVDNLDFGLQLPASISGNVWNDLNTDDLKNCNGEIDAGESGLYDWQVWLKYNDDKINDIKFLEFTDNDGNYKFEDLDFPGDYTLYVKSEVEQSYPGGSKTYSIDLEKYDVVEDMNFGYCPPEIKIDNNFCITGKSTGIGYSWKLEKDDGTLIPSSGYFDASGVTAGGTKNDLGVDFMTEINGKLGKFPTYNQQGCFAFGTSIKKLWVGQHGQNPDCDIIAQGSNGCTYNPTIRLVKSSQDTTLSVSQTSHDVVETSDTITIDVANSGTGPIMGWIAEANDSWLTIESGDYGENSGTIIVRYDANSGGERTGTITVVAPGAENSPQTVTVKQAAGDMSCPNQTCNVSTSGLDTNDGSEAKPFATIQHGIDVAKEDYTVLVHPGTYVENINFNGKNIIVKSTDGAENTVIDGNQNGTVVTAKSEETAKAVLDGFTITKGSASGIYLGGFSTPTLKNLIVENNQAKSGGGIVITSNTVWNRGSQLTTLENVVIRNNTATKSGGGLHNYLAAFDYKGGEISGNKAPEGAGAYLIYGSGYYGGRNKFTDVTFKDNVATGNGGGLYVHSSHNPDHLYVDLSNIAVTGNTAKEGSGIYCNGDAAGHTYVKGFDENVVTDNPVTGGEWQVYSSNMSKCHGLSPNKPAPNATEVELIATSNSSPICVGKSFNITFQTTPESQSIDGVEFSLKFDSTKLQANTITNSGVLDDVLTEDINEGSIDFAAGVWDNEPPSGEFELVTFNFTVLAAIDGTNLQFDSTIATFEGETLSVAADDETIVTQECMECKVTLQGRPTIPPANSRWETDLKIYVDGNQPYTIETDGLGHCILPEPSGNYSICVKAPHTLANRIGPPLMLGGDNLLDFGTLLEGDVDDNNKVELLDRSSIKTSKDKCQGDNGYIENADLDEDNCVNTADKLLFDANYKKPKGDENPAICEWDTSVTPPTLRKSVRDGGGSVSLRTTSIPAGLTGGSSFDVAILVDANQAVDATAVYLNFDPQKLRVNHLTAGDRFDDILENDFDNVTGHINFVAGAWKNDLATGEFTLVTINFTVLAEGGEKTLSFNRSEPRNTEAVGGGKSVITPGEEGSEVIFEENIAPATCQLYAVNDKGLNNSQFFTVNLDDLTVSALGPMYKGHDIESLAIHPETNMIYAASGDNVTNEKQGHFYRVDGETGKLFPVGSSGFKEIEDLAFSPDGTLYAWAKGDGLITINLTTGVGTLELPYDKPLIEGLTLKKNEEKVFLGAVGTDLWQYDWETDTLDVICPDKLLGETEALEITPEGLLLIGTHNVPFGLHAFDVETCQVIEADETLSHQYNDVEGIAMPVAACSLNLPSCDCDDETPIPDCDDCVKCPVTVSQAVGEALGLLAELKTPAEEYLGAVGQWPSIEELGGRNSGTYTANIVSGEFFFQATLKTVEEECIDPAVAGKNIRLVYEPDNQNWTCSSVTIPNGIPQEYLPNGCH